MVLVWYWCSGLVVGGAVVGGAVVCGVVGGGDLSNLKPIDISLEMGKCCPNFDSTLVVFYMLTTLYQLTHTLCHISTSLLCIFYISGWSQVSSLGLALLIGTEVKAQGEFNFSF